MSAEDFVVKLIGVTKNYRLSEVNQENSVLKGISFELKKGESLAIVGPSGSGKSTLLNIIGCLDYPSKGKVEICGKSVIGRDDNTLAEIRNRDIGFVFQLHHLLPQCTALENVIIPSIPMNKDPEEVREKALELLKRVGLEDRAEYRPGQLSGGERQRVAVVRALINSPKLILADEPTGALDYKAALDLTDLLLELNAENETSLIVVTHSYELASRMNKMFTLREGLI